MDFSVATLRCFDTVKVHHDRRWLRQQRLLCVSNSEILNCPFPAPMSQAALLFDVFAPAGSDASGGAASPQNGSHNHNAGGPAPSSPPAAAVEPPSVLSGKYTRACAVLGVARVTLADVKRVFNPSKVNRIDDIAGVQLKGTDHMCIRYRSDHEYYYNTPLAVEISRVLRSRFVAHSSAMLVVGNFDADTAAAEPGMSNPSSPTASSSSNINNHNAPSLSTGAAVTVSSPTSAAALGYKRISDLFQAGVIELPSSSDVDHLQPAAMELTRALEWAGGAAPAAVLASISASVQALAADAESWVCKTAPAPGQQQHPARGGNGAAAASAGASPASGAPLNLANLVHVSSDATVGRGGATTLTRGTGAASPPTSGTTTTTTTNATSAGSGGGGGGGRHGSTIVHVTQPRRALEFRRRCNDIRTQLVRGFLLAPKTETVAVQKSLTETLAFWRSPRRLPQFEDDADAELVAELALQNLLFCSPATFQNLWADVTQAHGEELERFRLNCRLLSSAAVPFAYFGIPRDFETVRFDLVKHHLQSLATCRTPSAMLNAVVSAIKSVIVCVKARHVLSRRWTRACSAPPPAESLSLSTAPSTASPSPRDALPRSAGGSTGGGGGGGGSGGGAALPATGVTAPSPTTATTAAADLDHSEGYWTREELDEIAVESRRHSVYNTDDVLPVFIYIVAYCGMPQLVLYHRFLEALGYDGEASERAFYVTVFASAVQWVLEWKKPRRKRTATVGAAAAGSSAAAAVAGSVSHHHHHHPGVASVSASPVDPAGPADARSRPDAACDDGRHRVNSMTPHTTASASARGSGSRDLDLIASDDSDSDDSLRGDGDSSDSGDSLCDDGIPLASTSDAAWGVPAGGKDSSSPIGAATRGPFSSSFRPRAVSQGAEHQ